MHLVLEIDHSLYDRARTIEIEKLRPKGIAMYARGITVYYVYFNYHDVIAEHEHNIVRVLNVANTCAFFIVLMLIHNVMTYT